MNHVLEPTQPHVYTCIYDLLNHQSSQHRNTPAIAAPSRIPLTYADLFQQVHTVLGDLRAAHITQQDCVAVVLPNGPEMAVAFLAIASAAICAPLNPVYRANEFDFYLSDLNAKALIIQAGLDSPAIAVAQAHHIPIIYLHPHLDAAAGTFHLQFPVTKADGREQTAEGQHPTLHTPHPIKADGKGQTAEGQHPTPHTPHPTPHTQTALILHTSGTTSRPKMVPLTHANLCASACNIAQTLELQLGDRCLNVMPLFHIHGLIGCLLSSIASGGSVVCTPGFTASQFFLWLEQFSPTWYSAVPTMHQAILEQADKHQAIIKARPLRLIRSSSAALPPRVLTHLETVFNAPVIEAYGMTEAAHQMASNPLPPKPRKPGSVGLTAGPEIAIMDEEGNLLSTGHIGEVVIRGANVTSGYANNPDANAKAFTSGWFRTGDQGYLDTNGYLFLNGRLKEIINRGGEKIAPQEVDNVLMQLPDVLQAVTFAVSHPSLGEDVAAAVVLKPHATLTGQMIRQFLLQHLADFKVPSQVIIVDAIPKGPTGKLQRIGLADQLAEHLKPPSVSPRTVLEVLLAQVMADVLSIDQPGIHDNFFALGGDSLHGSRFMTQVNSILLLDLAPVTLFRKPTIAELADEIRHSIDTAHYDSILNVLEDLNHLTSRDINPAIK